MPPPVTAAPLRAYVPFLYTRKGKRAGQKYVLHNVLLEDVVVLCLAFAWATPVPVVTCLGLLVLHLSFWLVYEIGYHENDHLAAQRERRPHTPTGAHEYAGRMSRVGAWSTSVLLAVPGCWLLTQGAGASLRTVGDPDGALAVALTVFGTWLAYLLLSRGLYALYNRIDAERRSFPYAILQLTRTAGYGVFLAATPIGVIALASLVLARWIPYMTYRDLGEHPRGSHRLTMLLAFVVLCLVAAARDGGMLWDVQTAVVLAYLVTRAHRPLRVLISSRPGSRGGPAGG